MERSYGTSDFRSTEESFSDSADVDESQYTFFGKDVLRGAGLGGLEDDEDISVFGPTNFASGSTDNEYRLFEKEETGGLGSLSHIDDLATTFAKLNKNVVGPKNIGVIGDRSSGSFSRESSSTSEWGRESDHCNWLDLHIFGMDGKRWSSQPHPSSGFRVDSKSPLSRASSYPEQQPQFSSDSILIPKSPFSSFPPPSTGSPHAALPHHHGSHLNIPLSDSNLSYLPNPNFYSPDLPQDLHYAGNLHQVGPPGFYGNRRSGDYWDIPFLPHTHLGHSHFRAQICNSYPLPKQKTMHGFGDTREPKYKSTPKGRQSSRFSSLQGSDVDVSAQKNDSGLSQFRSKYMSGGEIESILKIQHSASHSNNDSYVDDYYHQARVAKNSRNPNHRFCPARLRDFPSSRGRNNKPDSQHRDGVKICRPHSLFNEINSSRQEILPLEKEPMFAARIALEDCFCVILDVDDIDRLLRTTSDGGTQLRRKRHALLQRLVTSLELVDPMVEMGPRDDIVFLRLISLPKGRKLLSRFLRLLFPGGGPCRIVCMAIFRHLRLLFGNPGAGESDADLAETVCWCVSKMDLHALSACLVAVVCSSEQPPLRPVGGPAGDGATLVVRSVLDRAAEVVNDFEVGGSNRALWRASFDAFFGLLCKYCHRKYESIVRLVLRGGGAEGMGTGGAISREMPMEILRASLPHTNEQQRILLLDFVQRSMLNAQR